MSNLSRVKSFNLVLLYVRTYRALTCTMTGNTGRVLWLKTVQTVLSL